MGQCNGDPRFQEQRYPHAAGHGLGKWREASSELEVPKEKKNKNPSSVGSQSALRRALGVLSVQLQGHTY